MQKELTELILKRLNASKEDLEKDFLSKTSLKTARYFVVDNLLPQPIAEKIYAHFPNPKTMHSLSSFGKIKFKYYPVKEAADCLQAINRAIQDPEVVTLIGEITGVNNQIPDPTRFAGGISTLLKGYYINPHIDTSHDVETRTYYRTANVLYYLSPNWRLENGGNYELWDESVSNRILVPSLFNRLLVMETTRSAWHAVNPVLCQAPRCCIFNYYFSEQSPDGSDYFLKTAIFKPRPEQRFRRALARLKDRLLFK